MGRDGVSGRQLQAMQRAGELPVTTALEIRTEAGTAIVGLDEIAVVMGPTQRTAAAACFFVGLVADVVIVVAANQKQTKKASSGIECSSSSWEV